MSRNHIQLVLESSDERFFIFTAEDLDGFLIGERDIFARVVILSDYSDASILPIQTWEGRAQVPSVKLILNQFESGVKMSDAVPFGGRYMQNLVFEIGSILAKKALPI